MASSALITFRQRGKPRGKPVPRTAEQWAVLDAPHLEAVRTMAAAGASLAEIGRVIERSSTDAICGYLRRNGIAQARAKPDTRTVLVLIEPVRWPEGPGHQGGIKLDFVDTEEL